MSYLMLLMNFAVKYFYERHPLYKYMYSTFIFLSKSLKANSNIYHVLIRKTRCFSTLLLDVDLAIEVRGWPTVI